eukprot:scaffold208306_cov53-Prasinocladus_malaysianus.AAC.2
MPTVPRVALNPIRHIVSVTSTFVLLQMTDSRSILARICSGPLQLISTRRYCSRTLPMYMSLAMLAICFETAATLTGQDESCMVCQHVMIAMSTNASSDTFPTSRTHFPVDNSSKFFSYHIAKSGGSAFVTLLP